MFYERTYNDRTTLINMRKCNYSNVFSVDLNAYQKKWVSWREDNVDV